MIVRQRPEVDDLVGLDLPAPPAPRELVRLMIVAGIMGGRSRVIIVGDGREIAGVREALIETDRGGLSTARLELIDFDTTTQRR